MGRLLGAVVLAVLGGACSYDRPTVRVGDAAVVDGAGPDVGPDADGGCAVDDDCPSRVCQHATCVDPAAVRYVAPAGDDGAPCTLDAPCATIAVAIAKHPVGGDAFVSIGTGDYPTTVTIDVAGASPAYDVYLIGRGDDRPTIYATDDGTNVDGVELVHGRAVLRNLRVQGSPSNASSDAIWCGRGTRLDADGVVAGPSRNDGIECQECAVSVAASELRDNDGFGLHATGLAGAQVTVTSTRIDHNGQGGLDVAATDCTIASSLISRNGGGGGMAPVAAWLRCGALTLDGNTFAGNVAPLAADAPSELRCDNPMAAARNNLFAGARIPLVQGCSHAYSLFFPGPAPAGAGNLGAAPGFVSTADFHLTAASPAVDAGDPGQPPAARVDVDGQPRISGGRVDIGADELP